MWLCLSYRTLHDKVNAICYDQLKHISSLMNKPGKFWKHFQSLSKYSKPSCESQVSAMAGAFNARLLLMCLVQYQLLSMWRSFIMELYPLWSLYLLMLKQFL